MLIIILFIISDLQLHFVSIKYTYIPLQTLMLLDAACYDYVSTQHTFHCCMKNLLHLKFILISILVLMKCFEHWLIQLVCTWVSTNICTLVHILLYFGRYPSAPWSILICTLVHIRLGLHSFVLNPTRPCLEESLFAGSAWEICLYLGLFFCTLVYIHNNVIAHFSKTKPMNFRCQQCMCKSHMMTTGTKPNTH